MQYADFVVVDHSGDDYALCGKCGAFTPAFYVVHPADSPDDGVGACSGCLHRVISQTKGGSYIQEVS